MRDNFDQLISPVDREKFNTEYWLAKPGLFRPAPDLLTPLRDDMAIHDINALAAAGHDTYRISPVKRAPIFHGDGQEAVEIWRTKPRSTIVARLTQVSRPSIMSYMTRLMKDIRVPFRWCWPNLYFSREGSGFARHWDNHENFIIGLKGCKRFTVAPNRCLPYPLENAGYNVPPINGLQEEIETERDAPTLPDTIEFDVGPGDCVFIPRGHWHEATALQGDSVTLTWAVWTCTWEEMLTAGGLELPSHASSLALRTPVSLDPLHVPHELDLTPDVVSEIPLLRAKIELRSIARVLYDARPISITEEPDSVKP